MHFMKSLSVALGMLSLIWIGGLATADEVTQGKALFTQYCASCHGPNGAGDGPLVPSLSTPPANLRLLSLRFGNPLPQDVIARFIDGRADVRAHGPRDMPVWGDKFYAESNGEEPKIRERIAKLVALLQSIQTGAPAASVNVEWSASRTERETKTLTCENSGFSVRNAGRIMTGKENCTKSLANRGRALIRGAESFSTRIALPQPGDHGCAVDAQFQVRSSSLYSTQTVMWVRYRANPI